MAMYKGVNYDDIQSIEKALLKAKIQMLRSATKYADLKLSFIKKSEEEGIYNPKLFKKLMDISVEV